MIVLHHLNFSRGHRVIWLLEELGAPYRLVSYQRNEKFKAPPELLAVHPLGKSPVIQDGNLVLGESSAILSYIDRRYGGGRHTPSPDSDAFFQHDEWLQYVESTAAFPIMTVRIGALTGGLSERLEQFIRPTLEKTLANIAQRVSGREYIMGDQFTLADIQMAYPLEIADDGGMLAGYDAIGHFLARLRARPAFAKAIEVGGPMLPPRAKSG